MDRLSKEMRSWNMSQIRGRDTGPERAVRSLLHRMGYRFRLNHPALPGKPDLVLPRYRTVVFVHGCFWHRHTGCRFAYVPRSRTSFWQAKFSANRARDRKAVRNLKAQGWHSIVVWECELREPQRVAKKFDDILRLKAASGT